MPFHKGYKPWNKGLETPSEVRLKQSISAKNRPSPRWGMKHSEEAKRKISLNNRGGHIKGVPFTPEHIKAMSLSRLGKNKGKDNPNWKGGTQSQNQIERARFRKTIQKLVFKRDNYACVIGGKKHGTDLQVDHIQPWADYVELRFNISNCRTLCMDCHYLITYGKPKPKEIKSWGRNLKRIV